MENSTGVMLSEAQGPLTNLLKNLSGKHGDYWLDSLKKMLRKEEIPKPPKEVLEVIQSKSRTKEKLQDVIKYLEEIPVVSEVVIEDTFSSRVMMIIYVFPDPLSFSGIKERKDNYAGYQVLHDFSVGYCTDYRMRGMEYKIFNDFRKDKYENIKEFFQHMYELGKKYEESIPSVT